jgi:hypothetical protein
VAVERQDNARRAVAGQIISDTGEAASDDIHAVWHGVCFRQGMADPEIDRARTMTRVLDHYMVDPLIGLVLPGAGDLIGSLLGLYIVGIALKRRIAPVVIARMVLNLAIDAGIGFVPLIGDIADLAFKANDKNLALLNDRQGARRSTARDWFAVGGAMFAFIAVLGLIVYAIVSLIRAVF